MKFVQRAVVDGMSLSNALVQQQLFPELFVDMLSVGEQSGRLGQTLGNVADVYDRELDKQVKLISTLIPPLVMVGIAAVVGFVVFGILSAVFSMTKGLRPGI
jgi:type II secretory pathway component PulF